MLWEINRSQHDPGFKSTLRDPQVLWPLADQEELKRQVDIKHEHEPLTPEVTGSSLNPVRSHVTNRTSLSAASVSVPDAPATLHEHRERASEGEQTAQETPEEDGKVAQPQYFLLHHLSLV